MAEHNTCYPKLGYNRTTGGCQNTCMSKQDASYADTKPWVKSDGFRANFRLLVLAVAYQLIKSEGMETIVIPERFKVNPGSTVAAASQGASEKISSHCKMLGDVFEEGKFEKRKSKGITRCSADMCTFTTTCPQCLGQDEILFENAALVVEQYITE